MAVQVRIGHESALGWVVAGTVPGSAGTVSLTLDGVRITVDAIDPTALVELVIFAADRRDPVPWSALETCRRLLGAELAGTLADATAEEIVQGVAVPTPLWRHVAATARAQFLHCHEVDAPRLAALRLVAAAYELAALGADELLRRHAWSALPAAVALGRAAASDASLLDGMSLPDRYELADALTALTSVLALDHWDGTGGEQVAALKDLVAPPSDVDLEAMLAAAQRDDQTDAAPTRGAVPAFAAGPGQQPVTVNWSTTSENLRARLGILAEEAFAGAMGTGELPGRLEIQVPLRLGAQEEFPAAGLVARVQTWDETVLGEAPLRIAVPPHGLPRAWCRIDVAESADLDRVRVQGIHIDLAVADLAPLRGEELAGAGRAQARRAAIGALLADGANPDWATRLVRSWRAWCAQLIADVVTTATADQVALLTPIVRNLTEVSSGAPELADASSLLAATLLEPEGPTRADAPAARAFALALLREALRVRYARRDEAGADAAARTLAVAERQEDGHGE